MRLNEILTESQDLEEGPLLNKLGTAVGKGVGALAKGAGAVAGGISSLGKAASKGFQAGKAVVGQAGDEPDDATAAPQGAADATAAPSKVTNPAAPQGVAAAPAANPAAEKAGQTLYAQVKASVNQLDKKGKQRIMQLLQKSLAAPAPAAAAPAAAPQAAAPIQKTAPARNKPVKVAGKGAPAAAPAPAVQNASKINNGNIIAEGFTFFRQK